MPPQREISLALTPGSGLLGQTKKYINPDEWEDFNDPNKWEDVTPPKPVQNEGWLKKAWDWGFNTPLWEAPARWGSQIAEWATDPSHRTGMVGKIPGASELIGFGAGSLEGIGNLVSGLSTPGNLALSGLSGGTFGASRAGLPNIARTLGYGTRAASAPVVAHGASEVINPESTLTERAIGLAEVAGGGLGMTHPLSFPARPKPALGTIADDVITPPKTRGTYEDELARAVEAMRREQLDIGVRKMADDVVPKSEVLSPDEQFMMDWYKKAGMDDIKDVTPRGQTLEILDPTTSRLNASGESAASLEAISRQKSMQGKGEKFVVYDRTGARRELIGPDAVDYTVRQGETYGLEGPSGFTVLDDLGGRYPRTKVAGREIPEKINPKIEIITEPTTTINKNNLTFKSVIATDSMGKEIGRISYNVAPDGKVNIGRADVKPEFRRQSIATQLINKIKNTEGKIDYYGTPSTPEGTLFRKSISTEPRLPSDLRGAKTWFNMGPNRYMPKFESELDKAFFIIAQSKKSRRDADYLKFVMEATGLDESGARDIAASVRANIKNTIKNSGLEEGEVKIPNITRDLVRLLKDTSGTLDITQLGKSIRSGLEKVDTGLGKMYGSGKKGPIPPPPEPVPPLSSKGDSILVKMKNKPIQEAGPFREAWNLSRGLMSVDLPFITSAGLRQAHSLIGTKAWFQAWIPSIRSYGSKNFYNSHRAMLQADPLLTRRQAPIINKMGQQVKRDGKPVFKEVPSILEEAGVSLSDLGKFSTREEAVRSTLAERIPVWGKVVRANNRAYTAYLNDLRVNTFRNFYEAMPDKNNKVALKQLGEAVNVFTGRGSLKFGLPGKEKSLEKHAGAAAEVLFAPKLIASRMQMLNPLNYTMTQPQVRKEYLKSALRTAGAWTTFAGLGSLFDAGINMNPTSSDFGKIRIGDFRLDPAGGFQQFLVLASRLATGETTSSVSNQTTPFGVGFKPETRGSTIQRFVENKLHPQLKFFYDAAFASESRRFPMFDRTIQLAVPMITDDLLDLAKENPELLPFLAPLISGGMGAQFYTGRDFGKPKYVPSEKDIVIGGRR